MKYLKHVARRFKNGFREDGVAVRPKKPRAKAATKEKEA